MLRQRKSLANSMIFSEKRVPLSDRFFRRGIKKQKERRKEGETDASPFDENSFRAVILRFAIATFSTDTPIAPSAKNTECSPNANERPKRKLKKKS